MASYPRETVEFVPIGVTVDDVAVTTDFEVCVTRSPATRPTLWEPAYTLEGKAGILLDHEQPGDLYVWARLTNNPEVPVIYAGRLTIT